MVKDRGISASQQGDLDYLCGAYSLVNMMGYLFDGRVKRKPLMRALLREYSYEWPLEEWLTHGLDEPRMDYLIDRVLRQGYYQRHFPTKISQPFRQQKRLTTQRILTEMGEYLKGSDFSRLILISDQHHWSVITRIDNQYFYFFDSSGRRKSLCNSWSLKSGISSHQLFPDSIYFVEREF